MHGHRTVAMYRAIDLSLFAVILMVFETLLVNAAGVWFPGEVWSVSAVAPVTAIVMVRWGPWAALHAALGGFVHVLVSRGTGLQFLIYPAGNLLCLAVLPLVRKWGWERLRQEGLCNACYSILVLLAMQAGRAGVALLTGTSPALLFGFVASDVISYIFTVTIVWISSRLDGMLEDQKHYLARINEPDGDEGGIR